MGDAPVSELLPVGTKVTVTLYDCTANCGAPHAATIIELDPNDLLLPYRVRYDDPAGEHPDTRYRHETWAMYKEVTPA